MPKTITLRLDDKTYQMLKIAAKGSRRTISNFLEYAALSFLSQATYISDQEMEVILNDEELLKDITQSEKDIKSEKYKIVN